MRQTVITITLDEDIGVGQPDAHLVDFVLRDALMEYTSARGCPASGAFPGGVEEYVAKRYAGQSEKFKADKIASVTKRCELARGLRRTAKLDIVVRLSGDEE